MDYSIYNLVLEVTRKCNLACSHCMRGDAQNIHMTTDTIDKLLKHVEYINTVTFTGGEPTLNIPLINHFIDECESLGIEVANFYIVINGYNIPDEFIITVAKLWAMCTDNEASQVSGSNDIYHLDEHEPDFEKLKCFNFFSEREEKRTPYSYRRNLINQGRAEGITSKNLMEASFDKLIIDEYDNLQGMFYVNVNGDIMECCDLSYDNQEENIVCNVNNLEEFEFPHKEE